MSDVIVPRGGKGLIERITEEARVPVIKHLDGNCHVYVEAQADLLKALPIALNAKTHRYGVCNAMETLLVDEKVAEDFLPRVAELYTKNRWSFVVVVKPSVFLGDQDSSNRRRLVHRISRSNFWQ